MEETVETLGTIAAGGLLAREVERAHAPGHDHSDNCANCGAHLAGPFCQMCGQHGHVHRTAFALVHDIGHGVFHFEGKVWGTLPMLFLKPGELTRRYAQGERAKFVSPMALFLFSVFLLFAVTSSITKHWSFGDFSGGNVTREIQSERTRVAERVSRLEEKARKAALPNSDISAGDRNEIAADLAEAKRDLGQLDQAAEAMGAVTADGGSGAHSDISFIDEKLKLAQENPKLLAYKIKTAAYKYSWALIPISLPFIWLLFPLRRDVGMYDHAIFATYSLAFMMLFAVALTLLSFIGVTSWILWTAFGLGAMLHMYKQIKYAYGLGRFGALFRTWALLIITSITSTMFLLLLAWLGLAG